MVVMNPLRPITQRLNSTPVSELPRHAGFLASAILNCAGLLQTPDDQKSEASVQVHKLTTRVSALLHDKTPEGRFTGVVLVKALIEAGRSQCLHTSASSWVRALLSCLSKSDPPEIKRLSVYAVTRIFLLSRDHQSIMRETVTPNLPAFINGCLSSVRPVKSQVDGRELPSPSCLLFSVLQCWSQLIEVFPSTFRPFIPTIRGILLSLLSDQNTPTKIAEMASHVASVLHCCAPKNTASSEWLQFCQSTITAAHQAADILFRSIIEDWSTNGAYQSTAKTGKKMSSQVKSSSADEIGLAKWTGSHAGISRITILTDLLRSLVGSSQGLTVKVPLAEILDLTARFSAITLPSNEYTLRENKEVGRAEREDLYVSLPQIHLAVVRLHRTLATVYRRSLLPMCRSVISQIWDIFESNTTHDSVKAATYDTLAECLQRGAVHLLPADTDRLAALMRMCCTDLRSPDEMVGQHSTPTQNGSHRLEVKPLQTKVNGPTSRATRSPLFEAAWNLLSTALSHVPSSMLSSKTRSDMDRTAILVGHQDAMLSSVINPYQAREGGRSAPSIFPFWARMSGADTASEAVMRPRQPVIQDARQPIHDEQEEEIESVSSMHDTFQISMDEPAAGFRNDEMMADPSEQLDEELSSHVATDEQVVRKREREAAEAEPLIEDIGLSKKVKLETQMEEQTTQVTEGIREEQVITPQEQGPQASTAETVPLVMTANYQNPEKPAAETAPLPGGVRQVSDEDDDSDDSEIPQIDATLSSEEEDDDMEE